MEGPSDSACKDFSVEVCISSEFTSPARKSDKRDPSEDNRINIHIKSPEETSLLGSSYSNSKSREDN